MFLKGNKNTTNGFSVMELLIAISIFTVAGLAVVTAFTFYIKAGTASTERVQSLYLLDEGVEATRFMRDRGYSNLRDLSRDTPYYIATSTNGWATSTTPVSYYNNHEITLTVSDVYRRNSDQDIVPASSPDAKTIDADTIRAQIDVAWGDGTLLLSGTTSATTFFTSLFEE